MDLVTLVLTILGIAVFLFLSVVVGRFLSIVCLIVGGLIGRPFLKYRQLGRLELFDKIGEILITIAGFAIVEIFGARQFQMVVPELGMMIAIGTLVISALASVLGGIGIENNRPRGI